MIAVGRRCSRPLLYWVKQTRQTEVDNVALRLPGEIHFVRNGHPSPRRRRRKHVYPRGYQVEINCFNVGFDFMVDVLLRPDSVSASYASTGKNNWSRKGLRETTSSAITSFGLHIAHGVKTGTTHFMKFRMQQRSKNTHTQRYFRRQRMCAYEYVCIWKVSD